MIRIQSVDRASEEGDVDIAPIWTSVSTLGASMASEEECGPSNTVQSQDFLVFQRRKGLFVIVILKKRLQQK